MTAKPVQEFQQGDVMVDEDGETHTVHEVRTYKNDTGMRIYFTDNRSRWYTGTETRECL